MASLPATKMIMSTTRDFASSLTHIRPLTFAAVAQRLVPHPPDLIKWVKSEGGFVHPALRIAQSNDSLGLDLVSSEDIAKGSDLIALPHHIPLRFGSGDADRSHSYSVLLDLARRVPDELWAIRLGLKLLQERAKENSFWWPYISNLPETYNVPIFFSGDDIKNLQCAPLLHQVNKRCRFLLDFEKEVKGVLEGLQLVDHPFRGQDVDASSLGWAMSAVSSRAFRSHGEKDGTESGIPMMLALIDMCNHSFSPNAQIVHERDGVGKEMLVMAGFYFHFILFQSKNKITTSVFPFPSSEFGLIYLFIYLYFVNQVVSKAKIKQDSPLLLNYGCLSNDLFLLDYGFVLLSNPYDCIKLRYDSALLDAASMAAGVSSPNFSSPALWQQQILSALHLGGENPSLKVTLGGTNLIEGRSLAASRVLLSSDADRVQKHDLNILTSFSAEAPVGISTDVAALRTVIALCVIALEHFPAKIMDDESLLEKGVSSSTKLAIQFRMHKKSVIIDVMRNLTRRVKLLSSKQNATAQE
ncbi:Rubisco LSMT, substrate-binding domain [Dillenia turbinata]|uniref:Rubisco LSMT, substrate-binding domain n=1 Tax=Dillenia turbinata TaxID=194707 RepID=A0AAN8VPS1_9MAGN